MTPAETWDNLTTLGRELEKSEPLLAPLLHRISTAGSLTEALARHLAARLDSRQMASADIHFLYTNFSAVTPDLPLWISRDLTSIVLNDPAACDRLTPFLFFKGFHALQSHRLAHHLWQHNRKALAIALQSLCSDVFGVDIHPAARLGSGIMFDHATGIVIGETAVVEDDVLFWHGVTLGGRSLERVDRHPKIRRGASLGAGCIILGNIEIGAGAKIGAGAIVVDPVPANCTVVPAKTVITPRELKT